MKQQIKSKYLYPGSYNWRSKKIIINKKKFRSYIKYKNNDYKHQRTLKPWQTVKTNKHNIKRKFWYFNNYWDMVKQNHEPKKTSS